MEGDKEIILIPLEGNWQKFSYLHVGNQNNKQKGELKFYSEFGNKISLNLLLEW